MDVDIVQAGERMGLGLEKMNVLECVRGEPSKSVACLGTRRSALEMGLFVVLGWWRWSWSGWIAGIGR